MNKKASEGCWMWSNADLTAGCENPEKPFGTKTVLLPCRNKPLEERKVVMTAAFFPVSGNEGVIAMSINLGQFCPGFGLLSGFESCADELGSFIARAVAEILQEFLCCGYLSVFLGSDSDSAWISLNVVHVFTCLIFVCLSKEVCSLYYKSGCRHWIRGRFRVLVVEK